DAKPQQQQHGTEEIPEPDGGGTQVHQRSEEHQVCARIGHDVQHHQDREQGSGSGQMFRPASQEDDVDEDAEQYAEIRKHNAARIVHVARSPLPLMIDTADSLNAFFESVARAPGIALDTEFMREKTYRADLCLVQIAHGAEAVCIDPLALTDLATLAPLLTS